MVGTAGDAGSAHGEHLRQLPGESRQHGGARRGHGRRLGPRAPSEGSRETPGAPFVCRPKDSDDSEDLGRLQVFRLRAGPKIPKILKI